MVVRNLRLLGLVRCFYIIKKRRNFVPHGTRCRVPAAFGGGGRFGLSCERLRGSPSPFGV
jgi:hypothetical protein